MRTVGLAFEKEAPKKAKPAKGKAEKPEAKAADEQPAKGKAEKPEVDAAYGCSGGIMEGGGFTVGSFSWNPGTEGASTYRSDMEAAVRRELLGTPLLYAGIGGTR